jgi:hypothetical protein
MSEASSNMMLALTMDFMALVVFIFLSSNMASPYLPIDCFDKCKLLAALWWTQLNDVNNWREM